MRIAQLSPPILPVPPVHEGGTERVVSLLCEGLVQRGHEVTLFAPSDSTQAGVELVPPGPSVASRSDAPPSLPTALEAISLDQLAARADEFDIIHCHTEFAHHAALRACREKVVTTLHWRVDEADRTEGYRHFADRHVIAISHSQAGGLSGGQVKVIHHGIDAATYALGETPENQLCFSGRRTDQKRPDRAIRVARRCRLPLKLAGNLDIGNPTYFETDVEPELGDGIDYLGRLDDAEKETLFQQSLGLLFPIDWDEPFGLVMIEAMACGCPVIGWDRGSVREVIDPGVTGFIVNSIDEAIAAVDRLDQLDRARIREVFERRHTSARMAADHERYYLSLL